MEEVYEALQHTLRPIMGSTAMLTMHSHSHSHLWDWGSRPLWNSSCARSLVAPPRQRVADCGVHESNASTAGWVEGDSIVDSE